MNDFNLWLFIAFCIPAVAYGMACFQVIRDANYTRRDIKIWWALTAMVFSYYIYTGYF